METIPQADKNNNSSQLEEMEVEEKLLEIILIMVFTIESITKYILSIFYNINLLIK